MPETFSISASFIFLASLSCSTPTAIFIYERLEKYKRTLYINGMTTYSATKLRQNLYNILDSVIESGVPVEIKRKGVVLKIVPEKPISKWERLEAHDVLNGDPESIVSIDWSREWKGGFEV